MMEPEAEQEWTLPLDEDFDFYPETALLGPLEKGDDGEVFGEGQELLLPLRS